MKKRVIHFHCCTKKNNRGDVAIVDCIQRDLLSINSNLSFVDLDFVDLARRPALLNALDIRTASLIVLGGGGIFSSHFLPLRKQNLYLLRLLTALSVPVVTFAPGFCGPLGKRIEETVIASAAQVVKASTLSSVRDEFSQQLLRQQGIGDCPCIGDPALFYPLRQYHGAMQRGENRIIGFNLAAHDWDGQRNGLEHVFKLVTQAAKYFRGQGYKIRYFLQSDFEWEISRRFAQEVDCQIVDEKFPCILEKYRDLDFMVGMMLHSTIFSASLDIPVISLSYDVKNISFMNMMNIDKSIIEYNKISVEELIKVMKICSCKKENLSGQIQKAKSTLCQAYEGFLNKVGQLL